MNKQVERQSAELLSRAVAFHQQGKLQDAKTLYTQVLALLPRQPDALHLSGVIAHQQEQHDAAVELIRQAIAIEPRRWDFHSNLACALHAAGRLDEAIGVYRDAINIGGESAPLLSNLGTALQETKRYNEAESCYRRALELDHAHAEAHYNLGNLLREQNHTDAAIEAYRCALRNRPHYPEACVNLGNLLLDADHADEAINCFRQAIELQPNNCEAHYNLARALKSRGDSCGALAHYERAIALKPDHAAAHMLRGLILLSHGDFKRGWAGYEWRWQKPDEQSLPKLSQALWQGESLKNKTILVFSEQGLGDEIMFANCLPDVVERAEHCIIECDPRLASLYRRSFPHATVRPRHGWNDFGWLNQVRPIDYQVPVGNLSRWLRQHVESFPKSRNYLLVDPQKVALWQGRLEALGAGLKIGICWRTAGSKGAKDRRSIPLAQWEPLLTLPGAQFVNLQYGGVAAEVDDTEEMFGIEIHDWEDADPRHDLDNLAAQMAALDLVITVANANAHLAGALGLNVWTLLPAIPSWRWQETGDSSPWYPSMRLFREVVGEGWPALLGRVREQLEEFEQRRQNPGERDGRSIRPLRATCNESEALKKPRGAITDARWNLTDATIHEAYGIAVRCHKAGELERAEGIYREVLARAQNHVDALHRLGCLLRQTKRPDEGLQYLRRAAQIGHVRTNVQFDYAVALAEAGLNDDAERVLRRLIDIDPQFGPGYVNLGVVCEKLGKSDEALSVCQRGAQLLPESAQAHYNLANVYLHQGQIPAALQHYNRLLEIDPKFYRGYWNRGLSYLLIGDFARGWQGYRYREMAEQVQLDKFSIPQWDGSSLEGKTLLIHAEQGVGDEIMFNTCLPDVIEQAHKVHLTCDPRLQRLFARSFPQADVHGVLRGPTFRWQTPPDVDCYTHAGSLPGFLRTEWSAFPRRQQVLVPDPELVDQWRQRYAALGSGPKVGVSWRAGGHSSEQRRRTSLLDHWRPLFQLPDVHFVNLQYGDWRQDCDAAKLRWGVTIHDWEDADPLADLDNFAAQIAALDAVVSVGNTTIHMSGALGIPTWTVLPRVPGWRYLLSGDWLPWYQTVRLRRQSNSGDWDEVYARVATELESHFRNYTPTPQKTNVVQTHQRHSREPSVSGVLPPEKIHEAFLGAVKQHRAGRLAEAEQVYEQILAIDPQHADVLHLSGVLNRQTGRTATALQRLRAAVSLDRTNSVYAYNLSSALRDAGLVDEAIVELRRAISLNPHLAEAHLNLGTLLHSRGDYASAVAAYERALEVRPDYAEAQHNIGSALRDQGRHDSAIDCYTRAVAMKPGYLEAHVNLANTLREMGRANEALTSYERALALDPQNAGLHVQRAMVLLQQQRFDEGWAEWEWRWQAKVGPNRRPFDMPHWDGSSLKGKTLLVHMEQGIGDEIMFASCLSELIESAGRVIVECEARLIPLFARSFPGATWAPRESWDQASWLSISGKIDFQVAAGSVPRYLRRCAADFERSTSYLIADPASVVSWRRELQKLGPGLKVGISWRGGPNNAESRIRSIPLEQWEPIAKVPGLRLVSLQYGASSSEIDDATQQWQTPLVSFENFDPKQNLDELAALITALDVVISVSNVTVHLAGALGRPTWALITRSPTWRWFNEHDRAAWYPSVQLIRQQRDGRWEPVLSEVVRRLSLMAEIDPKRVPSPHLPLSFSSPITDSWQASESG